MSTSREQLINLVIANMAGSQNRPARERAESVIDTILDALNITLAPVVGEAK